MNKNLKHEILAAAQSFFNEKGYQETTMRDIASALGISLGNLTYHFHKNEAMIDSLIVNRFFYTVDKLGRATPEFYRHNVDMVSQIENHLELSLQRLSDRELLVPWLSDDERHAFTRMIMDSHLIWIKNSFYREVQDQLSYADFLDIHRHLLESHVRKEKISEYQKCRQSKTGSH